MATAPRPGAERKAAVSRHYFRITINGIPADIRPQDYGPRDEVIVRMATKKPDPAGWGYELSLQGLVRQLGEESTVGTDTLCTLWWFGRYKAGENVKLGELIDEFPTLADVDGRVEVEVIDPDATDNDEDLTPEG
jgi:hypothetical protein